MELHITCFFRRAVPFLPTQVTKLHALYFTNIVQVRNYNAHSKIVIKYLNF